MKSPMLTPVNIVIPHLMSWQYLVGIMFQNDTIIPREGCAVPRPVSARVNPAVRRNLYCDTTPNIYYNILLVWKCLLRRCPTTPREENMYIAEKLRQFRESKNLSQGDIEKRTGLLRCYISRVENGHTVPAIETLEKLARALEVPMYKLFYDGEEPPKLAELPKRKSPDDIAWGSAGKDARFLNKLRRLLSKSDEDDRKLILYMAQKVAGR